MSESFQEQHAGDNWQEQARTSHSDDQWHAHEGEAPPQHEHGAKASAVGVILISAASVVFVVALIIVVMIYFNQRVRSLRVEREERVDFTADVVKQQEHTAQIMGDYGWVDPSNGVIQLPIDRAIEITAEDYTSRQ